MKTRFFFPLFFFIVFLLNHQLLIAADVKWTYYDIDENKLIDPTEIEIKENAVSRINSEGVKEYALEIIHDFSKTWGTGYLENIGNPQPPVGKHWIKQDENITCKVDGIIQDVYNPNSRYFLKGYKAQGSPNDKADAHALRFDGIDDYITIPDINLNNADSFSIEFEAKRNKTNKYDFFISQGSNAAYKGFEICFVPDNTMVFSIISGKAITAPLTDYDWHTWRFEYKRIKKNLRIQKDNELQKWVVCAYTQKSDLGGRTHWNYGESQTDSICCWKYWNKNCCDPGNTACFKYDHLARDNELSAKCQHRTWWKGDRYVEVFEDIEVMHTQLIIYRDEKNVGQIEFPSDASKQSSEHFQSTDHTLIIGRSLGSTYLNGIMKNLYIYKNNMTIAHFPINDNAETITDKKNNYQGNLHNFNNDSWVKDPKIEQYYEINNDNDIDTINLPDFTINVPSKIIYSWSRKFAVEVSTDNEIMKDTPQLVDNGQRNYEGSGKWWFKEGINLTFLSKENSRMKVIGYRDNKSFQTITSNTFNIEELDQNINITWQYEQTIHKIHTTIGAPVTFESIPDDIRQQMIINEKPVYTKNDLSNMNQQEFFIWSDCEKKMFPIIGNSIFNVEWKTKDNSKIQTQIITHWPETPDIVHIAGTLPVMLDTSTDDSLAFKKLLYSENNSYISAKGEFSVTQPGKSVLLYSQTKINNSLPKEVYLSFDGINDYLDTNPIYSETNLMDKTNLISGFTAEFWAKSSSNNGYQVILSQGEKINNRGLHIGFYNNKGLVFGFLNNDTYTNLPLDNSLWHHYACVYEVLQRQVALRQVALSVDGSNGYIDIPDGVWFNGDLTIEAWVYIRNHKSWSRLIDFGNGTGSDNIYLILSRETSGKPQFATYNGTNGKGCVASDPIPLKTWTHIAATLQGKTGKIYINGNEVASQTGFYVPKNIERKNNYIAEDNWGIKEPNVDALFSDLRIWDIARNSESIKNDMNKQLTGNEQGLVGYWRFDDSFETIIKDSSKSKAHGTVIRVNSTNECMFSTPPPPKMTYLKFDGNDDYIKIGSKLLWDDALTFELNIKFDNDGAATQTIFNNNSLYIRKDGGQQIKAYLTLSSSSPIGVEIPDQIEFSEWHHLAVTWDGIKFKIYFDGALCDTETIKGSSLIESNEARLGTGYLDTLDKDRFKGAMDEVRMWKIARTEQEIMEYKDLRLNGNEPGLITYYRMDEGIEDFIYDSSPKKNNAKVMCMGSPELWKSKIAQFKRTVYVDGNKVQSFLSTDSYEGIGEFKIGSTAWDSNYYKGEIDELRIWNYPRTEQDIINNKDIGLNGNEDGLMNYYRFDDKGMNYVQNSVINTGVANLINVDPSNIWNVNISEKFEPATGDLNNERLIVRVVDTQLMATNKITEQESIIIGTEITSQFQDSRVPHNGFVFWKNSRYNPNIYNRDTQKGPIIPVNCQYTESLKEDDFVVIWFRMQDSAFWPYQSVEYTTKWSDDKRIVIASRSGSEGKDSSGNLQQYKDYNNNLQNYYDSNRYQDLTIYNQPNIDEPGYNPNEEHALIAPSFLHSHKLPKPNAVFALRNDFNNITKEGYTSDPYVLIQYYDTVLNKYKMSTFKVEREDDYYKFHYSMKAGEPVYAPYPLNIVIGAANPLNTFVQDGDTQQRCAWEDHKHQFWAISGNNTYIYGYFWYPIAPTFWVDKKTTIGDGKGNVGIPISWLSNNEEIDSNDGFPTGMIGKDKSVRVKYDVEWPENVPVLKVGETLTFPGGEFRHDNPDKKGLPGIISWAAGQILYDDMNKKMDSEKTNDNYLARLAPVLLERSVDLKRANYPEQLEPASKRVNVIKNQWYYKALDAGLKKRIFYDPMTEKIGIKGIINDKTLGDKTLTASPPSVYALQPNILNIREKEIIQSIEGANDDFQKAIEDLYKLSRSPDHKKSDYSVGLIDYVDEMGNKHPDQATPGLFFGPGLALITNPALLDSNSDTYKQFNEGYVTLVENNHSDLGSLPVALHIIKIEKDLFRGAIKINFSDNAFDEKITLQHTADFGSQTDDIVFQWWYREDDGTNKPPPSVQGSGDWTLFKDPNNAENDLNMSSINLAGAGAALLVDNLFFARYRHKNSNENDASSWSNWAGAANSRVDNFVPQLAEGWVKRVVNTINPFEARVNSFFNSDNPATYVSMVQQAGTKYEGAVAFNPEKDIIENIGLIELYQTVMNRAMDLSINLSQPVCTSGITSALLLVTTRLSDFYNLLGNEAYMDSLDPTIGYGTSSNEYGSLAPTIFTFMNQLPDLLHEELCLLRGREEHGARPVYNRLLWNFTKSQGEVAYALSYQIQDINKDGFIDEADARTMYPQGHGDAWGHYLTAIKYYYSLLKHPYFIWESRSERFSIEGVVMAVDYLDERKFAETAASKAKVGKEILSLTYRQKYVEDPEGQYQGYKDSDTSRAFGVTDWGRRIFTGAYFDWVTSNAILQEKDTDPLHTGIKKIDRTTVVELKEIASQAMSIQNHYDNINTGLNPLNLATDVVSFDIDPSRLIPGAYNAATHFEQIYERALDSLENARVIFDHASELKNRIRNVSESTDIFNQQVIDQDRDYRNRLIEIFGTPYEGTIGPGKTYPPGYQGPDYYFYNYVDVNTVSEETIPEPTDSIKTYFNSMCTLFKHIDSHKDSLDIPFNYKNFFPVDIIQGEPDEEKQVKEVIYPLSAGHYSFSVPKEWGMRKSPGNVQQAIIELVKAEADLKLAKLDYSGLLTKIRLATELLDAKYNLNVEQINILNEKEDRIFSFNKKISSLKSTSAFVNLATNNVQEGVDIAIEAFPKTVGLSNDTTSIARAQVRGIAYLEKLKYQLYAFGIDTAAMFLENDKELSQMKIEHKLQKNEFSYEIRQQLKEIEELMDNEKPLRFEIFKRKEHMRQVSEKYRAVLSDGLRLLDERQAFNTKVSAKVQGMRYQDMSFRLTRFDTLYKYRSAFELAARYVYLAGKAYDYETNLSDRDSASAKPLLTRIIRERTLGQYENGKYIISRSGLGGVLSRLKINFDTLKGQMGFNNPQTETGRFSLRKELYKIKSDSSGDDNWHSILENHRVDNLWKVPEFRKYCRPFTGEDAGTQPGIIIDFSTNVIFGFNLFGWDLTGGDHAYDPTNFATKVRSVGVWFDGYENNLLSETPHVYLIPCGIDIMLVPNSTNLDSREWNIIDQKLPTPLPIDNADLNNPNWIPGLDCLDGSMIKIRKFSSFRAYHDSGYFDANQMNFDSRLIGRSVWNTRWLLIIPGGTFHYDQNLGLETFINSVKDIKLFFQTYAISGN